MVTYAIHISFVIMALPPNVHGTLISIADVISRRFFLQNLEKWGGLQYNICTNTTQSTFSGSLYAKLSIVN